MNWTRGLFRLWLVVATIWILVVMLVTNAFGEAGVYLTGEYKRTDIGAGDLEVIPISDGLLEVRFEDFAYEAELTGSQVDGDERQNLLTELAIEMNKRAAAHNGDVRRSGSAALSGFGHALLPPLLLLALGASLLWALRGFAGGPRS